MPGTADRLPRFGAGLAVYAHPDDESFGLGAVLTAMVDGGARAAGLCFTHGEASTLDDGDHDLHEARARELAAATRVLGLTRSDLLSYPDGALERAPLEELAAHVAAANATAQADVLVTFDEGGITGHPDHRHATRATLRAAEELDLPVLAWVVAAPVATRLNAEFDSHFVGQPTDGIDFCIPVDRARQLEAIACHHSQSTSNPVLWRRLELTGATEPLRWLRPPTPEPHSP